MKKKIIICLIALAVLLTSVSGVAFANDNASYHYIKGKPDSGAIMTISTGLNVEGTIVIPGTWYAKFIGDSGDNKIVEYNGIRGSVNKSALSVKTTTEPKGNPHFVYGGDITLKNTFPTPIYTNLATMQSQTIKQGATITFIAKAHVAESSDPAILVKTTTMDESVIYGFVYEAYLNFTQPLTINENGESIDPDLATGDIINDPPLSDNDKSSPTNNVLKIILISAICILSVVVVFLIFKPSKGKKKKGNYYEDDNKQ